MFDDAVGGQLDGCRQGLTPGAELRMLHSIAGHFGLFGFEQSYLDEVDQHLRELLAIKV